MRCQQSFTNRSSHAEGGGKELESEAASGGGGSGVADDLVHRAYATLPPDLMAAVTKLLRADLTRFGYPEWDGTGPLLSRAAGT